CVGEIQMTHCFGNVTRLLGIKLSGLAFADRAKPTMPRADLAAQHKGRSPISPALEDVWALRFLTNSVQVQALNQLQQMILVCRIAQSDPEPFRFRLTWFAVQNLKFAAQESFTLKFNSAKTF